MTKRYTPFFLCLRPYVAAAILAVLLTIGVQGTAFAQTFCADEDGTRVCRVEPGFGTLNEAIHGDTTSTGQRNDPDTVYMLERDGIYILDGTIEHSGFHLRIYGADGDGSRPRLIPGVVSGGEADRALTPRGDLTIRGLYVTNQDELGGLVLRIIRVRENDVRVVVEDSHLDRAAQSAFRIDGTNTKIIVRNSIISNIGTPDSPNNGRAIDDRGNDIDSVVVVNSTFYNLTSTPLRDGGGMINYAEFDHNTFYNIGQYGMEMGQVVEAKVTNNLMHNVGFYGEAPSEEFYLVEVDSLAEDPESQEVDIRNNNFFREAAVDAIFPDTVETVPSFDLGAAAYVEEDGTSNTMLSEDVAFFEPPASPVYITTTYYADPAGEQEDWNTGLPEGAELTDPSVDVMPFDFAYDIGSASYTASTAGQPLGALTWWGIDIVDTASEDDPETPVAFILRGNYPNPFNPATTIAFDLERPAEVSVAIFDLMGREVMTLPSRMMEAGRAQTLKLDASTLASGVYVYQVQVRSHNALKVGTGRMVILK